MSTVGQTVQLTATATFSDGKTQNVTTTATWQSSNTNVATVSSSGLVTAVAAGTATITSTYQGKTATAVVPITLSTSTGNQLTATIDGTAFNAVIVTVVRTNNQGVPSGQLLGMAGTSGFIVPFQILDVTVPAAVGTYQLGPLTIPNGALNVTARATASMLWNTLGQGGSGTVTVTSVTANTASGTFSMTLVPSGPTGATGTKTVTNGIFNVRF